MGGNTPSLAQAGNPALGLGYGMNKYPVLSGGDVALSTLAQMQMYRPGLIPALISGLGSAYVANKQARLQNQFLTEQEMRRRAGQAAVLQAQGRIPQDYIPYISAGDDSALKAALDLGYNTAGVDNTNQYLQQIGQPGIQGIPNQAYQNALMNTLYRYEQAQPQMRRQTLQGDILEATKDSEIGARNARNQADIRYAVPTAGASLQGKQLMNQSRSINNRYAPIRQSEQSAIRQQRLQNAKSKSQSNSFQDILTDIEITTSDSKQFKSKALDALNKANVPMSVKVKAKKNIDDMAILKRQMQVQQEMAQPSTGAKRKPGNLGIRW